MKFFKKSLFCSVLFGLSLISCSSDEQSDSSGQDFSTNLSNGVFVINEGNSGPTTATISFISENGEVYNDIIKSKNPSLGPIGIYYQDLFFSNNQAFLVSAGSNTVSVFNKQDFKYVTTISENIQNPRYGVVVGDFAYITNLANFADQTDDFVTIIDLSDFSTTRLNLNTIANQIKVVGDTIYVSNGYYGAGNTISVINSQTKQVELIDLGEGASPDSFDIENNKMYVLTNNEIFESSVVVIDLVTNQILNSESLSVTEPKHLNVDQGSLYLTSGTSVYKAPVSSLNNLQELLSYESSSQWGAMYGFKVNQGKVYISDAGDFASDSDVYLYDSNGNFIEKYNVGIGPNGFSFH